MAQSAAPRRRPWRRNWAPDLLLAPALIAIAAVMGFPLVYLCYMSLHKWSLIGYAAPTFVGTGNFTALLGDDRFIGTTWFKEINRLDGNAELAIYMDRDHIGSGWGTDAQRTLLAFGFGTLGLERVWLTVNADNARAIRSYEKVGFVREGLMRRSFRVNGKLTDTLLMAILRDDWEAREGA